MEFDHHKQIADIFAARAHQFIRATEIMKKDEIPRADQVENVYEQAVGLFTMICGFLIAHELSEEDGNAAELISDIVSDVTESLQTALMEIREISLGTNARRH